MTRLPLVLCLLSVIAPPARAQQPAGDPRALAMIDRAVARMGGEPALRAIHGIRLDVLTQWLRTNLGSHPYEDRPSYEHNVDLRDYTINAWRNSRQFSLFSGGPSAVVVVRDTVAAITLNQPSGPPSVRPQNIAYVEERRELFAFAPERTLLLARDGGTARRLADTTINGVPHGRFSATVDGYPATYFMRRTDGLPAMVRFVADETNDFGLAPWGRMKVEYWYSGWTRVPPGVMLPRQLDVQRVGRPYKRMTHLAVTINPPAPADSFAIADSTVTAYFAGATRPMWDAPLDSARITAEHFASFPPFLGVGAAVRVGGQWVLLETGQAEGAAGLAAEWLARAIPGAVIGAGIVTLPTPGNGGIRWFAERRLPLFVAPGATRLVNSILGATRAARAGRTIDRAQWVRVGNDSLWIEPVHAPDVPGLLAVYSPTLRWLYAAPGGSPTFQADLDGVVARLRGRGLAVEWLGSARAIRAAAPATSPPSS